MNKKLLLPILCLVLFFSFSCNDDTGTKQDSVKPIQTDISKANVKKVSNPYNSLGILHNKFLSNMARMDTASLHTTTLSMIISSSKTFISDEGYDTSSFSENDLEKIANEAMNSQFDKAKIDELEMRYNFTNAYKNELYKLSGFLSSNNNYSSISEIINNLQNLENNFNNANVSENERKQLLAIIAITESSLEYWSKIFSNDVLNNSANNNPWFSRFFNGVKTDVLGAVIGSGIGAQINSEKTIVGVISGSTVASGGIQLRFMR